MPSQALNNLIGGLSEVAEMQKINPEPPGSLPSRDFAEAARALNRASLVMISSHYERYLRGINKEACEIININATISDRIPLNIKLTHLRIKIDELSDINWVNREASLRALFDEHGWLWTAGMSGTLNHNLLVDWMGSPKIENVMRYFKQWDIPDIFLFCGLQKTVEVKVRIRLKELVEKRNSIAHGDYNVTSDSTTIREYINCVSIFCSMIDQNFLNHISRL